MAIPVVCSKCRKSFKVSDKFAGQTGPCPQCKAPIKVPDKTDEVVVHGATEFADGGRSVDGQLLTKPIARKEVKLQPVTIVLISAAALVVVALAFVGGRAGLFNAYVPRTIALLLISPLLVVAPYTFLRDDEREPYSGPALYIRAAVCGTAYVILWGVFAYLADIGLTEELWGWLFVAPPLLAVGGLVALACFDLEYGDGFFHYGFYVLVTVLLRWIAGLGWIWESLS